MRSWTLKPFYQIVLFYKICLTTGNWDPIFLAQPTQKMYIPRSRWFWFPDSPHLSPHFSQVFILFPSNLSSVDVWHISQHFIKVLQFLTMRIMHKYHHKNKTLSLSSVAFLGGGCNIQYIAHFFIVFVEQM